MADDTHKAFQMEHRALNRLLYSACGRLGITGPADGSVPDYCTDHRFQMASENVLLKLGYQVTPIGTDDLKAMCPNGEELEIPGHAGDQESRVRAAVWAAFREGVLSDD